MLLQSETELSASSAGKSCQRIMTGFDLDRSLSLIANDYRFPPQLSSASAVCLYFGERIAKVAVY